MSNENNLFENFDFIEESAPFSTEPLEYQDVTKLDISESENSGSKWKLIGKVRGCMAPIGVYSRNHRIYENSHWIKVLKNPDLQERIANRRLFGMPSHMQKNIDDEDFREGRISHIVSVLEVRNDNNGKPFLYGEFDILDTPAGRILKAMYEGGAGIYVSTRAAGKLEPIPGDPINKRVNSDSYFLGGIDCVLNPGFLQARPMFEASPSESAQVSESEDDNHLIPKVSPATEVNNNQGSTKGEEESKKKQNGQSFDEILKQKQEELNKNESAEIAELNNKINQLTKIIEKVVDDVYEADNEPTQSIEEQLGDLLLDPSITEEAFEDVVAILKESKPELVNAIMENSRKKFNDEHAEKSGLEIEYYRFGGKKPYKVVPKGTDYFAASLDSPKYRSLKQAQKHVLDSYNKPKENASEALNNFVSLMASSNITEEAFEEILDMIKGDLK